VTFAPGLAPAIPLVLADAQTSGGLLIAVPGERLDALLAACRRGGVEASTIGRLTSDHPGAIDVVP
jgi:selenide,water dikinase